MDREEAVRLLDSPAAGERLVAANYFLVNGTELDSEALVSARNKEQDFYIKRRLDQALRSISGTGPQSIQSDDDEETEHEAALMARATEWVGGVILHEMESHIGRAALYASREIPNYSVSKTKVEIERLRDVFRGISQLVVASKPARPTQFDLPALIDEVATNAGGQTASLIGPRPLVVTSDRALLGLALANGLKNALEATADVLIDHAVIINWGVTDRDCWVSILDRGAGVTGTTGSKFAVGSTSKAGHSGFGLAVAKRVMHALGGRVLLEAAPEGGALYEVRWERAQ